MFATKQAIAFGLDKLDFYVAIFDYDFSFYY